MEVKSHERIHPFGTISGRFAGIATTSGMPLAKIFSITQYCAFAVHGHLRMTPHITSESIHANKVVGSQLFMSRKCHGVEKFRLGTTLCDSDGLPFVYVIRRYLCYRPWARVSIHEIYKMRSWWVRLGLLNLNIWQGKLTCLKWNDGDRNVWIDYSGPRIKQSVLYYDFSIIGSTGTRIDSGI